MVLGLGNSRSLVEQELDSSTNVTSAGATASGSKAFSSSFGGIEIRTDKKSNPNVDLDVFLTDYNAVDGANALARQSVSVVGEMAELISEASGELSMAAIDLAGQASPAAGPVQQNRTALLVFGALALAAGYWLLNR